MMMMGMLTTTTTTTTPTTSRKRTATDAGLDLAEPGNAEIPGFWQEAERQAGMLYSDDAIYDSVPLLLVVDAARADSTTTTCHSGPATAAPGLS